MMILVELLITTFYADIDGIVDHHFLLLILVELLITTFSVDIGGIVDHHFLC
jgi:hypothetical protein